jgi:hypothetical protein
MQIQFFSACIWKRNTASSRFYNVWPAAKKCDKMGTSVKDGRCPTKNIFICEGGSAPLGRSPDLIRTIFFRLIDNSADHGWRRQQPLCATTMEIFVLPRTNMIALGSMLWSQFSAIFPNFRQKKLAFFLNTNVMIYFFQNLFCFEWKNASYFGKIFRRKYLYNHNIGTSVPCPANIFGEKNLVKKSAHLHPRQGNLGRRNSFTGLNKTSLYNTK